MAPWADILSVTPARGRGRRWRPLELAGAGILALIVLPCLLSLPYTLGRDSRQPRDSASIQSRRFEAQALDVALLPPSWAHHRSDERQRLEDAAKTRSTHPTFVFGTDRLGRDLFIRCLAGGGISLAIGIAAGLLAVVIGTMWGALAGYFGGRTDAILMRIVDILYGLPYILLVVLLAVAVEGMSERAHAAAQPGIMQRAMIRHPQAINVVTMLIAIGGVSWLTMARVVRGQVLSLKARPFMEACRAIGVPLHRQFLRHLLPNLLAPIIVYATLTVPTAILSESFLSFLGIGVKEPLPSWGNLAADGLSELNIVRARWWLLLFPCSLIALTLLALNFLGEGLRERFDPRQRT
jgi:oligopeptide transport system permease protein